MSVCDVVVLLPIGFYGVAIYVDMQRVFAAGFINEVVSGIGNCERILSIAFVEEKPIEGRSGHHGIAFLKSCFPITKDGDSRFRGGGDIGFFE